MSVASRSLGSLLVLLVAILVAIGTAFAEEPRAISAGSAGTANLKDGAAVPLKWLPPGAFQDDKGPSTAIYPPQKMTLRFNHKFHVSDQKLKCESCHKGALTSESVQDRLTPKGTTCDGCHGTEHGDLNKVSAGDDEMGQSGFGPPRKPGLKRCPRLRNPPPRLREIYWDQTLRANPKKYPPHPPKPVVQSPLGHGPQRPLNTVLNSLRHQQFHKATVGC